MTTNELLLLSLTQLSLRLCFTRFVITLQRLTFSILVYPSDVSSIKTAHLPRHPFVFLPCFSHVLFRLICWDKRDGRTHLDLEFGENMVEIGVLYA